MEQIVDLLGQYGLIGLIIISFTESFISPILPDILLIPMALAEPEKAIYYSAVATGASILGGLVGYLAGRRFGLPIIQKFVPQKHVDRIQHWVTNYGVWAILLASLAPIPFKFVSISAGVFRLNMTLFLFAATLGRAKRFLLEGVLIYYYGLYAMELLKEFSDTTLIATGVIAVIIWIAVKRKRNKVKVREN
ncbi:MAG: DedA family protein [Veillonellaceae bacterium]|nr:DedA family protein [Veillonellaceae bacterium]